MIKKGGKVKENEAVFQFPKALKKFKFRYGLEMKRKTREKKSRVKFGMNMTAAEGQRCPFSS